VATAVQFASQPSPHPWGIVTQQQQQQQQQLTE